MLALKGLQTKRNIANNVAICVHALSLIQRSFAFRYDEHVVQAVCLLPALAAGWVYRMGLLPIVIALFI